MDSTHLSTQSQNTPSQHKNIRMNSFTFIVIAIGMVCASAHNGVVHDTTPVTCSEVLTSSDCTEVNPKSSLYTNVECGWGEDIDLCNTENCCGGILLGCITAWIGDGLCDTNNNNADCGNYDGGDCCECTCTDGSFDCGFGGGFNCLDPNANCGGVDAGELPMGPCDTPCLENCDPDWICTSSTSTLLPGLE